MGKQFDLTAFVAKNAVENNQTFILTCNCGATVTIMPPFQDEYVRCYNCRSIIRMLLLEGDPGYLIGANEEGEWILLPVQGSAAKDLSLLTDYEKKEIIKKAKKNMEKNKYE